jgi:hypothetical protein
MTDVEALKLLIAVQHRLGEHSVIKAILRIIIGAYDKRLLVELFTHSMLFVEKHNTVTESNNDEINTMH